MEKVGTTTPKSLSTKFYALALILFLLYLFPDPVFSARPLSTDDAGTVEKGGGQVEVGFDATRQDSHDKEYSPSTTLSYGLSDRVDLGVGTGYLFVDPKHGERENGISDTELRAKFRFLDEKEWVPAFAISGEAKIPTASDSKGLGSGKADFGINVIAAKSLSKRWVFHLNAGHTFLGEHRADNEFNYSLACQCLLSDQAALVGETVGVNNFNGHKREDPFSGLLGFYYLVTDNFVWDAGTEIGLNRAAPDFRLTPGLTILFSL